MSAQPVTASGQCRFGGAELILGAEQQDLIPRHEFFIGAWIDEVRAVTFDADNARAGAGAELEFDDEFSSPR